MKPNIFTKGSIFATFIVCCVILALLCSSLATDYWVTATGQTNGTTHAAEVNLGLFKGQTIKSQQLDTDRGFDVKLVCLTDGNNTDGSVCMFSCGDTADERLDDLTDLIFNNGQDWDQTDKCKGYDVVTSVLLKAGRPPVKAAAGPVSGGPGVGVGALPLLLTLEVDVDQRRGASLTDVPLKEPQFMSYGLWLSTIVMLAAAIVMTLVAAMFAILNTATTPVETIFGVLGLYAWNAIAMVFELLALSIWGAQFHQHLQHSVLWREELLQNWTTDGMASLGYSYWLVFVAMFLHVVNMAILWFGTHQMRPKTVNVPIERGANTANMIY